MILAKDHLGRSITPFAQYWGDIGSEVVGARPIIELHPTFAIITQRQIFDFPPLFVELFYIFRGFLVKNGMNTVASLYKPSATWSKHHPLDISNHVGFNGPIEFIASITPHRFPVCKHHKPLVVWSKSHKVDRRLVLIAADQLITEASRKLPTKCLTSVIPLNVVCPLGPQCNLADWHGRIRYSDIFAIAQNQSYCSLWICRTKHGRCKSMNQRPFGSAIRRWDVMKGRRNVCDIDVDW